MKLLLLLLLLPISCYAEFEGTPMWKEIHGGLMDSLHEQMGSRRADRLAREFENGELPRMAQRTDQAINGIIKIAYLNLKRHGYHAEALSLKSEWAQHAVELESLVEAREMMGAIGDFKPLSQWLATAYDKIEAKLGYQICMILRISDLKTLNYTIPVVFDPCTYGEPEFTIHFCHDTKANGYRGLAPVVTYWVVDIGCGIATYGAGIFFICSPVAMVAELAMDKKVAPWLAPKIYSAACN